MPLEIRSLLVQGHRTRPGAFFPAGCVVYVFDRRRPGCVVSLVVLRPERLEHEVRRVEAKRYDELGRHEWVGRHSSILRAASHLDTVRANARGSTWTDLGCAGARRPTHRDSRMCVRGPDRGSASRWSNGHGDAVSETG